LNVRLSNLLGFLGQAGAACVQYEPLFDTEHFFFDLAIFLPGEGEQALLKECSLWQRNQAQAEALRLLAAAGFDPRSCAGVFLPAADAQTDLALLQVYEQARRKAAGVNPKLPRQFLPAEQKVVIFPSSP